MKRMIEHLLILILRSEYFTSLSAQTDAERKILSSADSLNTQPINAYTGNDYPATEAICQKILDID